MGLDEETLRIRERVLGPEHTDTLGSRNNLAAGYGALGRTQETVYLIEKNLKISERVLGSEHPDTLGSRNNLAAAFRALGRALEAAELDEQTLRIRDRILGPEHPDTLQSRRNLAAEYRALGRDADADRLEGNTLPEVHALNAVRVEEGRIVASPNMMIRGLGYSVKFEGRHWWVEKVGNDTLKYYKGPKS